MREEHGLPSEFTGFIIDRDEKGDVFVHQNAYLRKLEELPCEANFSHFRSARMKLAWLANTKPDCLFEIAQLAQVTEEQYRTNQNVYIRRLNKAVKYAVKNRVRLKLAKLDKATIRVIGFSDSSFANNAEFSSQLGHIVLIGDASGNVVPFSFKSYKSRRVTRSAMSGEVIAFSNMFDVAISLAQEMETVMGSQIPVQLLTDSKSLFDVISKGSGTSEKRTMIDIAAARQTFRDKVISDIGFVRSSQNIADGLTKPMTQSSLRNVVMSGQLDIVPDQWILLNAGIT